MAGWIRKRLSRSQRPPEPLISGDQDRLARTLVTGAAAYLKANRATKVRQVLVQPSYYMITYTRLLDVFMTLALRVRGAIVRPVLLDPRFSQDFFFGGLYGGTDGDWYVRVEKGLWLDLLHADALYVSDFFDEQTDTLAADVAGSTTFENYRDVVIDGYPVGQRAADVVANQNNLARIVDREDLIDQLRIHVRHAIRQLRAQKRLIQAVRPDAVFSNVPFYYRWDVGFEAASGAGTPFYSAMMGERKNTFFFSSGTRAMLDVSPAWDSWAIRPLSKDTERALDAYIERRAQGQTDAFSPYRLPGRDSEEHRRLREWRDPGKPLVVFPVNVAYDAAAYQSSPVFDNLPAMVEEVVRYINQHPEFQLIIKAHPAEQLALTLGSDEFAAGMLRNLLGGMGSPLGENVMFLDWDSMIPMADLIPELDLGIVFTSSAAMEMAWAGKPVISAAQTHYSGKGFVYEPQSIAELWRLASEILTHGESDDVRQRRIDLSRKYYYLYFYHARVDFKLFQGDDLNATPTKFLFDDIEAILPGSNAALDYICDAILEGQPIFGDGRWPPPTP